MSQVLASNDQTTGVSTSASVLPMSIQCWFPLRFTGLISLLSKELSGIFSITKVWRHQFFGTLTSLQPYMTTGRTIALTERTFVSRVMSLLFGTLSRFVITFLPRSKHFLISWLQSPSKVILEPKKRKSVTASIFSPSICHEAMELDAMISVFFNLVLNWISVCRGPAQAGSRGTLRMNSVSERETRRTGLDRAKSARERERKKETIPGICNRVWQLLYFSP